MQKTAQLNKKGVTYPTLIALVIGVVMMLVLIMVINTEVDSAKDNIKRNECGQSVRQHTLANVYGLQSFSKDLKCPANEVKIKKRDNDEQTKEVGFRKIGNEMLNCWNDYGKGELDLFKEESVYCNVCSFIEFEEKQEAKTYQGFFEWMATNSPGGGSSYADRLAGYHTQNFKEVFDNPQEFNINKNEIQDALHTENLYSVIFVYARGKSTIGEIQDSLGGADQIAMYGTASSIVGGAAAGFMIGGPLGALVGVGVGITGTGASVYQYFNTDDPGWLAFTALTKYDANRLKSLKCENIRTDLQNN